MATPSVAFLIERTNCYRPFAPAIDAAMKRGWRVECWHHVGNLQLKFQRPLDCPTLDRVPKFRHGLPAFREYRRVTELGQMLRAHIVDVAVSLNLLRRESAPWFNDSSKRSFYVVLDPISADWPLHVRDPWELEQVDLFALGTQACIDESLRRLSEVAPFEVTNELREAVRKKAVPVGWPQADQVAIIDPAEVRRRWGISENRPVVTYLNWPKFLDRTARLSLFPATSLGMKARAFVRSYKDLSGAVQGLRSPDLGDLTRAIAAFCQRNNAFLIGKYRWKHRDLLPPERRIADKVVGDESYYPHTIMEVMSIADLSIGYQSYGVRESVGAGVPHLAFRILEWLERDRRIAGQHDPYLGTFRRWSRPSGLWNYDGVVSMMDVEEGCRRLPDMSMDDFAIDRKAWGEYMTKFIGVPGVPNSDMLLDAVGRLIDGSLTNPPE